jgi:predicted ArsR family transcriptional regulator
MMEGIGRRMVSGVTVADEADFEERIAIAVGFMDERGYMAHWERTAEGDYLVHIANCPYEGVAGVHSEVCQIDRALLTSLLGPTLAEISRNEGPARHCTYVLQPACD